MDNKSNENEGVYTPTRFTIIRRLAKQADWHREQSPSAMKIPKREYRRQYVTARIKYETQREQDGVCIGGVRWVQL